MYRFSRCLIGFVSVGMMILGFTDLARADLVSKAIVCPATGTSIQVAPANGSRLSLVLLNDTGPATIRFGANNIATLPVLDDNNSTFLLTGASYSFNVPGVYLGRILCMSTSASSITIHTTENTYP